MWYNESNTLRFVRKAFDFNRLERHGEIGPMGVTFRRSSPSYRQTMRGKQRKPEQRRQAKMRATIILLVLVVSLTVSALALEHMETAESMGRGEAQAGEQPVRYEASQMNGAHQYTPVWALCSLGAF